MSSDTTTSLPQSSTNIPLSWSELCCWICTRCLHCSWILSFCIRSLRIRRWLRAACESRRTDCKPLYTPPFLHSKSSRSVSCQTTELKWQPISWWTRSRTILAAGSFIWRSTRLFESSRVHFLPLIGSRSQVIRVECRRFLCIHNTDSQRRLLTLIELWRPAKLEQVSVRRSQT